MFIKASRETHSGELVLIVRPNGETAPARCAGKTAHSSAWCITVVERSTKFPFGLGCVYWTLAINEGKRVGEKVTASNRKGYGRVKRKRGKEKNCLFFQIWGDGALSLLLFLFVFSSFWGSILQHKWFGCLPQLCSCFGLVEQATHAKIMIVLWQRVC